MPAVICTRCVARCTDRACWVGILARAQLLIESKQGSGNLGFRPEPSLISQGWLSLPLQMEVIESLDPGLVIVWILAARSGRASVR
jgi:hypothetical protein